MAFNPATARAPQAQQPAANTGWKADAFLNFYLPRKNGTKMKVGSIPLRSSKSAERAILDWINEDPETNSAKLLNRLMMEYNPVVETTGDDLDLD